jgi:hypothetical protein
MTAARLSFVPIAACMAFALAWSTPAEAAPKRRKAPAAQAATPTPAPAPAPAPPRPRKDDGEPPVETGQRGPARIEFDDRLVQGQTNKANAIYLFERRESALRTLLKKRTNFHEEIDEMLDDELVR